MNRIPESLRNSRIVVDDHIVLDNSTLEQFTTCPRSFFYHSVLARELNASRSALSFGQAIHTALEIRYKRDLNGSVSKDTEDLIDSALRQHFIDNPPPGEDYRNYEFAKTVVNRYNTLYVVEPFAIMSDNAGEPIVERPFAHSLGHTETGIPVIWAGRIDLATKWSDNRVSSIDHKTTAMFGPTFFDDFINSQAQIGYSWALQQEFPEFFVSSFVINALVCRKPTATGKGIEFQRQVFHLDPTRMEEWRLNVLEIVSDVVRCAQRESFPMHFKSCVLKYGRCQYLDACSMPLESRPSVIHSNLYRDVEWSPLNRYDEPKKAPALEVSALPTPATFE